MMRYFLLTIHFYIYVINGYLLNPPELMHISYGNTIDSMVILGSTRNSSSLELERENIYPIIKWKKFNNGLMILDYKFFRCFPNGASMIGSARKV